MTIEDKIELFRNIIYREIEESASEKELKVKEGFEREKGRLLAEVEAKRRSIVEDAVKKAEKEKQQIIAKANSQVYHRMLDSKQGYINEIVELLAQTALSYTAEEGYRDYLLRGLDKAASLMESSESVRFYFTKRDLEALGGLIEQKLSNSSLNGKYIMQEAARNIIGGFYAEDGMQEIQIDYTFRSLIEENHELIGRYISRSFEEVQGDGK